MAKKLRIVFYPAFFDDAVLTDQYYRALWYLKPVEAYIERVDFYSNASAKIGSLPEYFDKTILQHIGVADRLFTLHVGQPNALTDIDDGESLVLIWDQACEHDAAKLKHTRCFVIDVNALHEGDAYLEIAGALLPLTDPDAGKHSMLQAIQHERKDRSFIFGTGPSLANAYDQDFSDGVSVVCNSAVKDELLLEKVRPRFIVAADPIFHSGCSSYAQHFREALIKAMRAYQCWLLVQARDAHVYHTYLPADVQSLIIPVPVHYQLRPNTSFPENFFVTSTRNVMTMFLIPLGAALGREIAVLGCDGRKIDDNAYFWKHHEPAQFNAQMSVIQNAHPGFFTLDYQDYYALHCETVRRWIMAHERNGKHFISLTPSYIPALAARAQRVDQQDSIHIPVSFELHSRIAFWIRSVQSVYGSILTRFAKRPGLVQLLRCPVIAARIILRSGKRA